MRILCKLQSFLPYRLLEVCPKFVSPTRPLAAVLFLALAGAAVSTPGQEATPGGDLDEWIERLGDLDWHQRQRATEAILETGPAAVPSLRSRLESSDPEVAERIRWLLSILDPAVYEVVALRLGEREAGATREIREWISLKTVERTVGAGTTRNRDGTGTRLSVSVDGSPAPIRVLVRRADEDLTRGAGRALQPGLVTPLVEEDHIEEKREKGKIERTVRSSLWILWLKEKLSSRESPTVVPSDPEMIRSALDTVLVDQQHHPEAQVREEARRIVSFLREPALLRDPVEATIIERGSWQVARSLCGDVQGVEELEHWIRAPEAESAPAKWRDAAALGLAEAGSAIGFDLLIERLTDMGPWNQYRALRILNRYLESGSPDPERVAKILTSLGDPESFAFLPWRTVETELIFQNLEACSAEEDFARMWLSLLAEGLPENTPSLLSAQDTLLRSLWRLHHRRLVHPKDWLRPVLGFFDSRSFDSAFGLVRHAHLAGDLSPEEWDEVLERIASSMSGKGNGNNFRTSEMIRVFTRTPGLTVEDVRRLWQARIQCFRIPASFARERVDRELDEVFEKLEEKRPARDDQTGWESRLEARMAQIDAAAPEILQPGSNEEFREFRLCEVDFRIDQDQEQVVPIDFRQRTLRFGVTYPETGPDGGDRSVLLSAAPNRRGSQVPTHFVLGTGVRVTLDQPVLVNSRSRYRFSSYLMTDSAYGRRSLPRNRTVLYKTLVLLEDAREAIPVGSWPELATHVVNSGTATASARSRDHWLKLIRELRLQEAKPALREIYAESPEPEVSRTLLSLGDPIGVESLREGIENIQRRVPIKLIQELIEYGDGETIAKAIDWVKSPPPKMKAYTYPLLDSLERVLGGPKPVAQIDETRFLDALMSALGDGRSLHRVITLLRARTGNDFGYYSTLQIRDPAERKTSQSRVVERWNDWWKERHGTDRRPPAPTSGVED